MVAPEAVIGEALRVYEVLVNYGPEVMLRIPQGDGTFLDRKVFEGDEVGGAD
jgi:hypothetical protein